MEKAWIAALCAALWVAGPVQAREPVFKCSSKRGVTYSQVQCPGGKELVPTPRRVTRTFPPPPQDRAVLARRAPLSDDAKRECRRLDAWLPQQEQLLRTAFDAERDRAWVQGKLRYREMGC